MKKRIASILALVMLTAALFTGCKETCDICGESKDCETIEIFGEKITVCDDCMGY